MRNRPFLKWPGGKMRLIHHLLAHLPQKPILVEPFVGAGALFANTDHRTVFINDINADLINVYHQLKKRPKQYIRAAEKLFNPENNDADRYYELRDTFNQSQKPLERASLFLYLNRHGYNGLCRYNASEAFNVPFGHYKSPYFPARELSHFAQKLEKAQLSQLSYEQFFRKLYAEIDVTKVVCYCDPPYAPLSKTASFTRYAPKEFTLTDQATLASHCQMLWKNGAGVMISNHDVPLTRRLYRGAKIKQLPIKRLINCRTDRRQQEVVEMLGIFP